MSGTIPYTGVNHVALVCRDMAETVDFYENVLEMPLVRSIGLGNHGQHFFFDCGARDRLAASRRSQRRSAERDRLNEPSCVQHRR